MELTLFVKLPTERQSLVLLVRCGRLTFAKTRGQQHPSNAKLGVHTSTDVNQQPLTRSGVARHSEAALQRTDIGWDTELNRDPAEEGGEEMLVGDGEGGMVRGVRSLIHQRGNGGVILLSNQLQSTAGVTTLVGYSTMTNVGRSRHGLITHTTPSTDMPRTVSFFQPPLPAQDPSCQQGTQQGTQTGVRMGYEITQGGIWLPPITTPRGGSAYLHTPITERNCP